jgi:hypothetical protein
MNEEHQKLRIALSYLCCSGQSSGRAPALWPCPRAHSVERGRHPPGPCSRDLVSAKCSPCALLKGRTGAWGQAQRPCPRHAGESRGDTHPGPCSRDWCQLNGFPHDCAGSPFDSRCLVVVIWRCYSGWPAAAGAVWVAPTFTSAICMLALVSGTSACWLSFGDRVGSVLVAEIPASAV